MTKRKPKRLHKKPGGGGARHPNSLANLRPNPAARNVPKHGAYAAISVAELEGKTGEVYAALSQDAPVQEGGELPAADAVVVRLLAETLVRVERIADYIVRRGFEDDNGNLRPVVTYDARLRQHALALAVELGMTPRSRAALGLDLRRAESFDLARHWQERGDG